MRTWGKRGTALAIALALGGPSARAADKCQLLEIASIDMSTGADGSVSVPMKISGHEANMLVDTGGMFSTITSAVSDEIGQRRQTINIVDQNTSKIIYYDGAIIRQFVNADSIQLGNLSAARMTLFIMPEGMLSPPYGGTLAPDIMRRYDVDFDFAKGKFNLFSPEHCEGQVVYWTQGPFAKIPMILDDTAHVDVTVLLDGKELRAELDTGSARSVMRLPSAKSFFDLDEKSADMKVVEGSGKDTEYRHPFHALTIGDIQVVNPDIVIMPDNRTWSGGAVPLILGMGILRQLHLYLAYREQAVYATAAETR
jgi:predicted aspartyl protease